MATVQPAAVGPEYELAMRRAAAIKQYTTAYAYKPKNAAYIAAAYAVIVALQPTVPDDTAVAAAQAQVDQIKATLG